MPAEGAGQVVHRMLAPVWELIIGDGPAKELESLGAREPSVGESLEDSRGEPRRQVRGVEVFGEVEAEAEVICAPGVLGEEPFPCVLVDGADGDKVKQR